MPKKLLSTQMTPFYKWVLPAFLGLLMLVFVILTVMLYRSGGFTVDWSMPFMIFAALAVIVFGVAIFTIWHFGVKLKRVEVDDYYLYVSDFTTTLRIPLTEIESVEEWKYFNPVPIWVHFRNETRFGKQIVFYAGYRLFSFGSHPTFKYLQGLLYY